ncbi:MAG TPA: helix-turn-helix domain-containing protein [Acidimicrobiales bacterium]|nr:helix-turn-helix domain-containing protein [Acidimicrobiales bacterium]
MSSAHRPRGTVESSAGAGAPGALVDGESFSAAVAAVAAAFGDATRRQIYLFAREVGGATAAEVARRFALHPNVARHHLDKLAAGGYLEVTLDHQSGGAGRPSKRYRAPASTSDLPMPPRHDALVVSLLTRALALLEPELAERLAVEVGEEYGRALAAQMAPGEAQRSLRAAMAAVADALTAHGFAAHADTRDAVTMVVRDHCPFGELVLQHPVLCAVDRGMVQGMLAGLCGDSVSVQLSSRALGAKTCASVAG